MSKAQFLLLDPSNKVEFTHDPVGKCILGRSWAYWCAKPSLFGVILWGQPTAEDTDGLVRALTVDLPDHSMGHRTLMDTRRVGTFTMSTFRIMQQYIQDERPHLDQRVTKVALLHEVGFTGAVAAGFNSVANPPYEWAAFENADQATDWLGGPDLVLLQSLDDLVAEQQGLDVTVARLRLFIMEQPQIELARVARRMGMSERTLQRRLSAQSTTFQHEVSVARVRLAQRRMRDGDEQLTSIAHDLGFSSLQHFSRTFKKVVGVPPSSWDPKA